jgi:ribulose 1,5-bisphosphate synthetase/thiazole synthase
MEESAWMYNMPWMERPFREELDKFIEATKKDATKREVPGICCPCRSCKNLKVWIDPVKIRSHVIVEGFGKDYTIWYIMERKVHRTTQQIIPSRSHMS